MEVILAIDPGNEQSAYVIMNKETYSPQMIGKVENHKLLDIIKTHCGDDFMTETGMWKVGRVVIEKVASYGMPVGREVFDTCEWVGRFAQAACELMQCGDVDYVYRRDEKLTICHDSRANDASIRRALIDRFAKRDLKRGTGTKANPDWFYGFRSDIWSAYAVGVTWLDMQKERAQ